MATSLGDNAPDFTIQDAFEKDRKLEEFKGKWTVLYFYPKDDTPGCTIEAIDFSGLKNEFEKMNAVILGISKDSCKSHQNFIDKQGLTITLLSDPELKVMKDYGVWKLKKFMGKESMGTVRTTFLIDPKGVIQKRWDNVKASGHAGDVLEVLKSLN